MFSIPNNGPYFQLAIEEMDNLTLAKKLSLAQNQLDASSGAKRELLVEFIRESAKELRNRWF